MRLDKYLKVARIIKRRTVANSIANNGRVKINGTSAKPSQNVRPGDIIEIAFGSGNVTVEVLDIRETVKKKDVSDLYRIIGSSNQETSAQETSARETIARETTARETIARETIARETIKIDSDQGTVEIDSDDGTFEIDTD